MTAEEPGGHIPESEVQRIQREADEQLAAELEILAGFLEDHPEAETPPAVLRECGPEIATLQTMMREFALRHPLDELHAITDLSDVDAPKHPIREPARLALVPIHAMLYALERETNISPEVHAALKEQYLRLSAAVGMFNDHKIDHSRG